MRCAHFFYGDMLYGWCQVQANKRVATNHSGRGTVSPYDEQTEGTTASHAKSRRRRPMPGVTP